MYYRPFLKKDIDRYVQLASTEFKPADFCDKKYLLERWDKLKGFILIDDNEEWIGWCCLSFKEHVYNPGGAHFLASVTFPNYRGKGYSKYLYKIRFDHAKGFSKSVCISANNTPSVHNALKYGFFQKGTHKIWNVYLCPADYYPEELKNISLEMRLKPEAEKVLASQRKMCCPKISERAGGR